MNFAFYDLETTGISPAFDQPLQFAAILTDAHFREIERVDLRCRIAPHIIPSPWALAVTGLHPQQLVDPDLPNLFELSQSLSQLVSRWSPAIWTGFNSIRFDEEMLRQVFYQNLQANVFATQFNGNTRFDIMTAVFAVWNRNPEIFDWPADETGRVRFNLDRLAPSNGFNGHNAHDALGDVEATIHIARAIAQRDPALWAELLENRHKASIQAHLEGFQPMELFGCFGAGPPRGLVGCFCGYSASNPNQAAFFDLEACDPADLIDADERELFNAVDGSTKIIRSVSINKSPPLLALSDPTDEQLRRARLIAEAPVFRERVACALAARFPSDTEAPLPPIERQIFDGFYSYSDKALIGEFQKAEWPRRQEIVVELDDKRLRQLGRRLVAFYAPSLLVEDERQQFDDWLHKKWTGPDLPSTEWMTLGKARRALDEMRKDANCNKVMIDEINQFLCQFD
ncbi:exonuclease domain-containing protein [Yoonia sediminilitoris]|uniref:Exodeoxyribonuclease I subunit C n=1 Tax=Yoonia sediminilitoris TaxID=1286148 RepID=A0A2T6K7D3_9RHOB|nr:exonuclease domain-containing protein [Yoonia sediminilitoris]PUB10558.1 exodeoxyribonuclease I subunit C [Yoonia sediminilitoris]RCW90061.1 exodeoxyribonuclease I subunit C [Yoonia sediminilitoris]